MTNKLKAINEILSSIGQAPINTLEGVKSYFTISAEQELDSETERIQMVGWDFNSEDDYILRPNTDGEIKLPENILMVKLPSAYKNRFSIRSNKMYDKYNHTFKITNSLRASIILKLEFEELPRVAQKYATMSAANKFVKKALGSQTTYAYTREDMAEAMVAMQQYELETGDYTLVSEFYTGEIKDSL